MKKIIKKLKSQFAEIDKIHRQKAIDDLEWEVTELKHVFALNTLGFLNGSPTAPVFITLDLLPHMKEEVAIMLTKINTAHNPLSEQFSKMDSI
jgi:hypothetical protein